MFVCFSVPNVDTLFTVRGFDMTFGNDYGVVGFPEKDFSYRWLGAQVSFTLLGKRLSGIVKSTSLPTIGSPHTLDVEFKEGSKLIIVRGHFNCFRKVRG